MPADLDLAKILSVMKKAFHCNGFITLDDNREIMSFSGDQSANIYSFLIGENICNKEDIICKGFFI
jgi:hypothetical protein